MTYSIIIPHKNVPVLLNKLLESIPQRSDTEVIIVDDRSDSSLVDFEHFPGLNRANTHCIFLKESHGAGHARNIGIEKSTGKWLLFADADDSYTSDISIILDKYADDERTELVILNARMVDENGRVMYHRPNMYVDNYLKKRLYSEKVIRYEIWTPWSRMVKRSFVNKYQLKYEEIPVGNDMMFCLKCSQYAQNIAVEGAIVYNYLQPVGRSVTNTYSFSIQSLESKVDRAFRRNALYKEVGYAFRPTHLLKLYKVKHNPSYEKAYLEKYKELLKNNKYSYFKDLWYLFVLQIGRMLRIV